MIGFGCPDRVRGVALAGLMVLITSCIAHAEYLVAPGDTIEVRMAGVSELPQRAQVQQDGTVSLPGVGDIRVGGLGLADMRAKISAALASRVLRQRSPDGQQHIVAIQPGDVTVGMAEYAPIYVSGDVFTPGQHPYRPSRTVRQAIALAGGYSLVHGRLLESADPLEVQSEYVAVGAKFAQEQVHAARLQAELDGKKDIAPVALGEIPVPKSTIAELLRGEREALRISAGDYELQQTFLLNGIQRTKDQLGKLNAELAEEEKGLQADQQDLAKAQKAYGNGNLPSPRVLESRHSLMATSNRILDINSSINQTRQQMEDFTLKLDHLNSDRQMMLLSGISDSRVKLVELRTKLKTLRRRIELLENSRDQGRFEQNQGAEYSIVRKLGNAWTTIPASIDTELQPGDVITVHIKSLPGLGTDDADVGY